MNSFIDKRYHELSKDFHNWCDYFSIFMPQNYRIKVRSKNTPYFKYLFIGWLILVLIVSSIPHLPNPNIEIRNKVFRADYLIHWMEYLILSCLFVLWRTHNKGRFTFFTGILALLLGVFIASLDEIHQLLIPGRSFNPFDMLYNYLGVLTGIFLGYFLSIKRLQKSENDIVREV